MEFMEEMACLDALSYAPQRGLTSEVQHYGHAITARKSTRPNRAFNVDAKLV